MKQIELTSYQNSGDCQGSPGDLLEVTDANRAACEKLVADRGARAIGVVKSTQAKASEADTEAEEADAGLSDSLTAESPVEALAEHGIGSRYIKALKDGGLLTIGHVQQSRDGLAVLPGVSPKAAADILKTIDESAG